MQSYYIGKLYETILKDLRDWIWNNEKLKQKITIHNLQYLFEFDKQRGLSIDLRRFEPDYYRAVFYPPDAKKAHINEFVRKVCLVIRQSLVSSGKPEVTLTITVRHMVSELSYWRTFYIDQQYKPDKPAELIKKDTDWHYRYNG